MNKPIKVGFAGGGFMGQMVHLPNFMASQRCEVGASVAVAQRMKEAEHFLQCIQEGRQPQSGGGDSLRDMQIAEDIFRIWQQVQHSQ